LHDVELGPRLLHGVITGEAEAFDRRDGLPRDGHGRPDAGAHRLAVDEHRTSAALRHAAPELRSGQSEHVPERPEERHVLGDRDVVGLPVDGELQAVTSRGEV